MTVSVRCRCGSIIVLDPDDPPDPVRPEWVYCGVCRTWLQWGKWVVVDSSRADSTVVKARREHRSPAFRPCPKCHWESVVAACACEQRRTFKKSGPMDVHPGVIA